MKKIHYQYKKHHFQNIPFYKHKYDFQLYLCMLLEHDTLHCLLNIHSHLLFLFY